MLLKDVKLKIQKNYSVSPSSNVTTMYLFISSQKHYNIKVALRDVLSSLTWL